MRVAIFIRSYHKDAEWLEFCLRSIAKFATGFAYTMIVAPSQDHAVFAPMREKYGFRLHEYNVIKGKEMLHGEVMLCRADMICPDVDAVCLFDSDCVITNPFSPLDNLVGGKPIIFAASFEYLASTKSRGVIWQGMCEAAIGFKPKYETMHHPTTYLRGSFAHFRNIVEKHTGQQFDQYVLSQRNEFPQTFAELTSLGAVCLRDFPDQYFFFDWFAANNLTLPNSDAGESIKVLKLNQYWSRGGITPEIRRELEEILK